MKSLLPLVLLLMIFACKSDNTTTSESATPETEAPTSANVKAVCVSSGVPVRAEPKKDGKWLTSLNLGEVATYLGETAVDSSDRVREYYKVELSDGSVVWARSYGLLLEGKPAAIIEETPIYKRPDLVNKTDKSFFTGEFIVIVGEKEDWYEVVGSEKRKKGWINQDAISTMDEEVAVATLAQKEVLDKNGNVIEDKLADWLQELPYKETMLAGYFEDMLNAEEVESAIEESIMEYEEAAATQDTSSEEI